MAALIREKVLAVVQRVKTALRGLIDAWKT